MQIPGLITVRTSSSRLPNKCLLPFGESTVIEHVIQRTKHYGLEPIICTSTDSSDDILEEISKKHKVRYFRGSLNNKLQRWADCCEKLAIDVFHTIDADDPFFDGEEMKRSFLLQKSGYDMVSPTKSSSAGGATVGYTLTKDIIDKACTFIKNIDEDTEMVWAYIEKVQDLKSTELPEKDISYIARLTLDYEEDYWLLKSMCRIIGPLASRQDIANLFITNPDFKDINWFRNLDWKAKQDEKVEVARNS
jgi:spore coat polysaccharide biosynthesis protein SpsF